jgi:uncharacterized membrane protein YpjA
VFQARDMIWFICFMTELVHSIMALEGLWLVGFSTFSLRALHGDVLQWMLDLHIAGSSHRYNLDSQSPW